MECAICLTTIADDVGYKKWKCTHTFHKQCSAGWHGSCPMCRCLAISSDNQEYTNKYFNIQYYLSWASMINSDVSVSKYLAKWKNKECIDHAHEITFHETYSPIGICHNCSLVQSFNM